MTPHTNKTCLQARYPFTLKQMVWVRNRLVLCVENKHYHGIAPEQLEAQGVLIGVIRQNIQQKSSAGSFPHLT